MKAKLTVLIPCRNEQSNIRDCILAARSVADEILVADSGSEDRTLEIVQTLGNCRLIQRQFVTYADFKNWAIPQATHPWVFVVDADERVTEELAAEIHDLLADPPAGRDGFYVPRRTFFLGHELRFSGVGSDRPLRLFRRDACRYDPCRVHESIRIAPARSGRLRHALLHFSNRTYDQYFRKHVEYTRWAAHDQWEQGQRSGACDLLLRPCLRFLQLYLLRCGFLDGMPGLQHCMLQSFFVSFVKQARLWEMQYGRHAHELEVATTAALGNPADLSDEAIPAGEAGEPMILRWPELGAQLANQFSPRRLSRAA